MFDVLWIFAIVVVVFGLLFLGAGVTGILLLWLTSQWILGSVLFVAGAAGLWWMSTWR